MTVLLSGANRGIGLSLAKQLKAQGKDVIAVVRSSSEELDALGVLVHTGFDMGDDGVVAKLKELLKGESLELVLANAGILRRENLGQLDYDSMRSQFEINSLGPLRMVEGALDALKDGGKVALVTSRMGSIDDNGSGGMYGYRMSKAALNMAGVSLARDLEDRQIAVAILHPGLVATRMTNNRGITTDESASGLLARIAELTLSTSGTFWHQSGEVLPW